jgi:diguanylate cyclase (GGDEF)-like protein
MRMPESTSPRRSRPVRIPRPEPTALSALALLSRDSLERACRHAGLALGVPVAIFDEESKDERDDERWVRLCVVPSARVDDAVFCANVAELADDACLPAVRYASANAFAALPLSAPRAGDGAAPADAMRPALVVLSAATRHWKLAERHALHDIAAGLAAELAARAELAELHLRIDDMRRDALRDALTQLPTRALLLDHLELAVERARRHKDFRFAVLSIDLDRFQTVNDSLGHEAGDELLVAVARRLESCVRGEDTVARLSADEFAVILESLADDSDGGRVADRIQRALAAPVETKEGDVFTSASIGIVLSSSGLDAPAELLQRSGIAVARAKAAGRARYEMFDRAMQARARARLRTETDLHRAVERGEFQVYYQPLVTLDTGRITEVEALLRWRHPDRGIVSPLDFIPLAEETGLIIPIGSWILAEACRQTRLWQARFQRETPLSLSVNLSVKQFSQPEFVRHVASTLAASGLDPTSLKLEITESFAIEDAELTRAMLEELRRLGTRIYLDDFGTGYSSLGYLHRLPLDAIKIDRSFVMQMDAGPTHLKLVDTVRALAHNIGVAAVAEGVETEAQLRTLRALGCESAQGFLFSRPVPPAEIETLLDRDPRW